MLLGVAVEQISISQAGGRIYIPVSPDAYALEQLICGKTFWQWGLRKNFLLR